MNKYVKYGLLGVAVIGILAAVDYFLKKNKRIGKKSEVFTRRLFLFLPGGFSG